MRQSDTCTLIQKSKGTPIPVGVPFAFIKDAILGTDYELGVSFLSATAQKKLNTTYRKKDSTTNVLSFPLSENSGDITFDLVKVRADAPLFDMNYTTFVKFLFIHGCLHLKGFEHSSTMEKEEKKFLKLFS